MSRTPLHIAATGMLVATLAHGAIGMCEKLVVNLGDDLTTRAIAVLLRKKVLEDSRERSLPRSCFNEGAFAAEAFIQQWNAIGTFTGGQIYEQLLLRWADLIEAEHGKAVADWFLLSQANRLEGHEESFQALGTFPSLFDLANASRVRADRNTGAALDYVDRELELLLETHLDRTLFPVSGATTSAEFLKAQIERFRLTGVAFTEANFLSDERFLPINFHGFRYSRPLVNALSRQMVGYDQRLWGGTLHLSNDVANQITSDLRLLEEALNSGRGSGNEDEVPAH